MKKDSWSAAPGQTEPTSELVLGEDFESGIFISGFGRLGSELIWYVWVWVHPWLDMLLLKHWISAFMVSGNQVEAKDHIWVPN